MRSVHIYTLHVYINAWMIVVFFLGYWRSRFHLFQSAGHATRTRQQDNCSLCVCSHLRVVVACVPAAFRRRQHGISGDRACSVYTHSLASRVACLACACALDAKHFACACVCRKKTTHQRRTATRAHTCAPSTQNVWCMCALPYRPRGRK